MSIFVQKLKVKKKVRTMIVKPYCYVICNEL